MTTVVCMHAYDVALTSLRRVVSTWGSVGKAFETLPSLDACGWSSGFLLSVFVWGVVWVPARVSCVVVRFGLPWIPAVLRALLLLLPPLVFNVVTSERVYSIHHI